MVEWAAIGAMIAFVTMGIGVSTFWSNFGGRLSATHAKAEAATEIAKAAQAQARAATEAISVFREHVAREYANREVLKEVEERLSAQIGKIGERIDRFMDRTQ